MLRWPTTTPVPENDADPVTVDPRRNSQVTVAVTGLSPASVETTTVREYTSAEYGGDVSATWNPQPPRYVELDAADAGGTKQPRPSTAADSSTRRFMVPPPARGDPATPG